LLNQQETPSKEGGFLDVKHLKNALGEGGSSETYTQNSSEVFTSVKPAHIKTYDPRFVEWFTGFVEGDGSFAVNKTTNRVSFVITQKNPQVLYYLKKNLGFGKVYLHGDTYYRYVVSDRVNLTYLIHLFSKRLILRKTNARYKQWVEAYNKFYKLESPFLATGGTGKICKDSA